ASACSLPSKWKVHLFIAAAFHKKSKFTWNKRTRTYRDVSFENAIAFARDLVRIPSISGDEGAVAERVLSEFKLLGFDETWTDEIGNVFAQVKGRGNAPAIMLSSHLDVVDAGDRSEWEYPPFDGQIAEGSLHGRGAV